MNWGSVRDLFAGVAWKRLTAHEVDPRVSNGHEFQGVGRLRELLGTEPRRDLKTTYLLFGDDDGPPERVRSVASWYDARANYPNRTAEWRLYYPSDAGAVQARMRSGDLMVIAVLPTSELAVLLAPQGSEREAQLAVLFGLDLDGGTKVHVERFTASARLSFAAATILEDLGLAAPEPREGDDVAIVGAIASELVSAWGRRLPDGRTVARLIQDRIPAGDPSADPDGVLHRWIEAQAAVYRLWEDEVIRRRINAGFVDRDGRPDIEAFREFTMSLRQSRVSRAGGALQLHTARVLKANDVQFGEQVLTENNERPDFVFPSAVSYHDPAFPAKDLYMLGVKFTLKDRWRQVLNEAARIREKHLLTMDPAVTKTGIGSMKAAGLTLVIPSAIRASYPSGYRSEISTMGEFIAMVRGS